MDSKIYKQFKNKKIDGRIVALNVFADGVSKNLQTFNTLIVQLYDLDTPIRLKTFLNGAAKSHSPNLNQMLDPFIDSLNNLWKNGIFIKKINKKVYPYLHCFLLDGQARPDYLMQSHHGAEFFCNGCLVKGRVVKMGAGHSRIYPYGEEDPQKRTHEMSKSVADGIEGKQLKKLPFDGIKGRTPIYNIEYLDVVTQIPPFEPMHTIFGIVKRDLNSMNSISPNICSINKNLKLILNQRISILKKYVNSNLKRNLYDFDSLNSWKTNQFADFLFYISPIVFESLINEALYGHNLVLVYIIGRLWGGGIANTEIETLENLIHNYLNHHKKLFPETDQTSNLHSMTHFLDTYFNLGPFGDYNGFIFESINGEIKDLITSVNGKMEQIATRSEVDMVIMVKDDGVLDLGNEFECKGAGTTEGACEYFNSIQNKSMTLKTRTNGLKDSYIMTKDYKFYSISKIYKEDNLTKIDVLEVVADQTILFKLGGKVYSVQHIFRAAVKFQISTLNVSDIAEKVIFLPKFDQNSSIISNSSKGFIIRTIYKYHN